MPATKTKPRPNRSSLSGEIRDAIERSGSSAYAIAKAAGIDPGIIIRFMTGKRGMTTDTLDRIGTALGLHLAVAKQRIQNRSRRPARPLGVAGDPEPSTMALMGADADDKDPTDGPLPAA